MSAPQTEQRKLNSYPNWAPRFWHGMGVADWLRMYKRNRYRASPYRWGLVLTVSGTALVNSSFRVCQDLFFARKLASAQPDNDIIFIIGHWRSGTTLLHELMVLDDRFAFPTTYECFAASHFLFTGRWMPKLIWFLLPAKRPMDDMAVSFAHPQEDEFALISLGAPSPLFRMAYPNHEPPFMEFLDMENVAPEEMRNWQEKLRHFVKMQMYVKQKPLVLKNPAHTGRVQVLAEMFPKAKFIHITRNPYELYSSTVRLWKALDEAQTFQRPREENLEEYVFSVFERMYRGFERQRLTLPPDRICDVRYEDLIKNPTGIIERIYEHLQLGDFEPQRAKILESMKQRQGHRTNRHEVAPEIREQIERRWSDYIRNYGYSQQSAADPQLGRRAV